MTWRDRLQDMVLAGGALMLAGCGSPAHKVGPPFPCGNANPDPCICGRPDADPKLADQCDQERACQSQGGQWDPITGETGPGAISTPHCVFPDGGADAGAEGADDGGASG